MKRDLRRRRMIFNAKARLSEMSDLHDPYPGSTACMQYGVHGCTMPITVKQASTASIFPELVVLAARLLYINDMAWLKNTSHLDGSDKFMACSNILLLRDLIGHVLLQKAESCCLNAAGMHTFYSLAHHVEADIFYGLLQRHSTYFYL